MARKKEKTYLRCVERAELFATVAAELKDAVECAEELNVALALRNARSAVESASFLFCLL